MIIGKSQTHFTTLGAPVPTLKRMPYLALLGLTADMDMDGDFADDFASEQSCKSSKAKNLKATPAVEGVAKDDQPLTTERS